MKRLVLASSITLMLLSSAAFAAPRQGGHGDHGHASDHAQNQGRDHDHDNDRDDGRNDRYWRDHQ